jgi:Phosphodiester glycosidase
MRRLRGIAILFLILPFLVSYQTIRASESELPQAPTAWEVIAPGIEYQKFHLNNPRPVNVFVTRMDRNNADLTIESSIAQGKLATGRESITGMADRYNQAINFWGGSWGERNRVVVAINGYFFDGATGTPWSGVANSGWYAKRFDDYVGDAGFAWTLNRTAHIGSCVFHNGSKNIITFTRTGYNPSIRGVNQPAGNGELILYTPQYDTDTNTESTSGDPVLEILIEMTRPSLVLPYPAMAMGTIRDIRDREGSMSLPFDHVVISAWGEVRATMLDRIAHGAIVIGDSVGISQEISDCSSSPRNNWTKTYASIGGDYHFLNNGVIRTDFSNPDAAVRNSRTAIAFNDSYIYFIVVDGFDAGVSEGLSIAQLADFAKITLQATWGITLDSGTSSTMVINGKVINNTQCNFTRDCGMALGEDQKKLQDQLVLPLDETYKTEWDDATGVIEPLVGTGMLMVVSEPAAYSYAYGAAMTVTTKSNSSLHLGPGNNFGFLATIPQGSNGVILPNASGVNGVLAKGSYWWKADFNGIVGWVREENLVGGRIPFGYKIYLPEIGNYFSGLQANRVLDLSDEDTSDAEATVPPPFSPATGGQ